MAHANIADSPDMFADSEDFMDIDIPPECDIDNIGRVYGAVCSIDFPVFFFTYY